MGRFLALLELYREQAIVFEQITPLGDLTIRWVGQDDGEISVTDEFDMDREVDQNVELDSVEQETQTSENAEITDAEQESQ